MTEKHAKAWTRLQRLSCYHATQLWCATHKPESQYVPVRYREHYVPEVIKENIEILGKGTEEQVKARILWYIDCYPDIFRAS